MNGAILARVLGAVLVGRVGGAGVMATEAYERRLVCVVSRGGRGEAVAAGLGRGEARVGGLVRSLVGEGGWGEGWADGAL